MGGEVFILNEGETLIMPKGIAGFVTILIYCADLYKEVNPLFLKYAF